MSKVYIVVNLDLGWDNVVGVFDTYEKAEAVCKPTKEDLEGDEHDWYVSQLGRDGLYEMHHIHEKEVQ